MTAEENSPGIEAVEALGPRSIAARSVDIASTGDGAHIEQHVHVRPEPAPSPADVAPRGESNVPWSDPRLFVGRGDALARLAVQADGEELTVHTICGLPGVGKSTLARHHAHRNRERYTLTWWITADTEHHLSSGLADLTYRLNPALRTAITSEDAAAWAVDWLTRHSGWLVILDNVEDFDHIGPLLQQSMAGHLVVTTRRDLGGSPTGTQLRLDVLDEAESVAVLTDIIGITGRPEGDSEVEAARRVAAELGHLPLALQQAGAYVAQTRSTLSGYLERLRSDPARLYDTVPEGGAPERTVARIWHHTLQAIEQRDPGAVQLLRTLAHFAPDDIPRDVFRHADDDPVDIDRMLSLLNSYSLITLTSDTVSIHRLLQSVIRSTRRQERSSIRVFPTTAHWARSRSRLPWRRRKIHHVSVDIVPQAVAAGGVLHRALAGADARDPQDWPRWRKLLPHVEALFAQHPDDLCLVFPDLTMFTCSYLLGQGLDARALPYGEMALRAAEKLHTPDHVPPNLALALDYLTVVHCNLGNYTKARELAERCLDFEDALDDDQRHLSGAALNNLATTHRSLGRYEEALPLAQKSLEVSERTRGCDPVTSVALSNLGLTMGGLGRHDESLELAERALAMSRETLPLEHPTNLTNLSNLAIAHLRLENYEDAERLGLEALEVSERVLGEEHALITVILSNLAAAYTGSGRPEEALPLIARAADISGRTLGPAHPTTLTNLRNLASVYCNLGRNREEVAVAAVALTVSLETFGAEHPLSQRFLALLSPHQDLLRGFLAEQRP